MTKQTPHLVWAVHDLPHDIFRVLALRMPAGGLLAMAQNAVICMKALGKKHTSSNRKAVGATLAPSF
eukprot:3196002-Amphidinium_carterae.1